ncbi:MAG: hypothetical protein G01um101430_183 [Parcubacteria group bacterium Gr01-1014_30]|nr:MAG: hypothetical protein G01um101430_183 [Parcubacteria group bacterium Gr01-1014_30]
MKILFTGGGTAGHIMPIIAVARELRSKAAGDLRLFYLGPKDEFSEKLLSQEGITMNFIFGGKLRRYFDPKSFFKNAVDVFFKIPLGFFQAFYHIFLISPDIILSKGGYGSLPTVLAGWFLLTPVFLHESDVVPGLANKIMSRFSLEIFASFPVEKTEYFPRKKMLFVGNPIRAEILLGSLKEAEGVFRLKGGKPLILVLGGSQGSQRINDVLLAILPDLLVQFEIIHQTGAKNLGEIEAETNIVLAPKGASGEKLQDYYHARPFLEEPELKHAFAAADLVISRAGSGTIFEIAALGKPSLLIPLPEAAQNHQLKNAYVFASSGACQVLEESNLTPRFFLERVKYLLGTPDKLAQMAESAREFSKPLSAKLIADYIEEYLNQ